MDNNNTIQGIDLSQYKEQVLEMVDRANGRTGIAAEWLSRKYPSLEKYYIESVIIRNWKDERNETQKQHTISELKSQNEGLRKDLAGLLEENKRLLAANEILKDACEAAQNHLTIKYPKEADIFRQLDAAINKTQ